MKKEKNPDGFPKESPRIRGKAGKCDNCVTGGVGFHVDCIAPPDEFSIEERYYYSFCCQECAEEFAKDNGLRMIETPPESDVQTKYTFVLADPAAPAEDDDKPKHKLCADGFPDENHTHNGLYDCDNCGLAGDFNKGYRVDAVSDDGEHDLLHMYSFCDQKCAEEFAARYGLVKVEATDEDHDKSVNTDYTFKHVDPVAAAVKTILPEDATPEDGSLESSDDADQETELADNQEELFAADDPVHKKKITECWADVVERAKEIAAVQLKIVETKETLKYYQKEYEALVKKQNDYILTNGNGIQLTFDDVPADQSEPTAATEQPPAVETVDPDEWKLKSVRVLTGFTEKQMDKIEANFATLGAVQEWSCKDYREKMPGIGQALQDKLIDAMSDYAVAWQQKANYINETAKDLEESENV